MLDHHCPSAEVKLRLYLSTCWLLQCDLPWMLYGVLCDPAKMEKKRKAEEKRERRRKRKEEQNENGDAAVQTAEAEGPEVEASAPDES